MLDRVIRRIKASLPLDRMPCTVAEDRHQMLDGAFQRKYGKTKQEMPNCDIIDHADPEFHDFSERPYTDPPYDQSTDRPKAEAVVVHSRTMLPTCVAHANDLKGSIIQRLITLHGLRRKLNPGESEQTQRTFDGWERDRLDKAIAKQIAISNIKRLDAAERSKAGQPEKPEPIGDEGLEYYTGADAPTGKRFDVGDLLKQYAGWDAETEDNEPDSAEAMYRFDDDEE
jgi:hypothetical protein